MSLCYLSVVLWVLYLFNYVSSEDLGFNVIEKDPTVKEVAKSLVEALGVQLENATNKRFQDLKEKLEKINSYVIDKEKYAELLLNETVDSNLTQINFYKALNESNPFQYLFEKDPKNLYLKLKERMNRDDILKILSEKKESGLSKSARRMMDDETLNEEDGLVDYEVDQIIAEKAEDTHKFDLKDIDQMYWDPKAELEDRQGPTRRIFKGERTTVRQYPFMVSIHVMKRFWCGGVLYWHDLVITSASCLQLMHNNRFFRENPRVLQVRVGSNHSRVGGEMVDALEVYFNPGYNPRTLRNNIAVIRLRYRLFFSYHRLPKIIRISHSNFLVPYTSEVLLLGWGVIRATSKMRFEPVFMQRKVLPVYPNKFCKEVYGDKFVTEQMFCAGTMTTGEGACDHDAGGPAVLNGRLVGIISFGPTVCGFPNAPTVFTLVGAFSDWIETVNESMPAYYRNYKKTTSLTPSTFDFSYISAMLQSTTELAQTPANTMREVFSPATTSPSDAGRHRMFKRHKLAAASPDAPCTFSISTRMLPPWIPTVKKPKFPFTETTEKSTTSKKFSISIRPLPEWVGTPDIPKWLNQTHEPPSFQPPAPPYRPPIPGETHPPPPTPNLDIATLFPKRFPYRPSTTHVVPNYGYTFSTASSPQWYFTLRRKAAKKSGRGRQ